MLSWFELFYRPKRNRGLLEDDRDHRIRFCQLLLTNGRKRNSILMKIVR